MLKRIRNYQNRVKYWLEFKKSKKGTQFNKEQNTVVKFVIPLLRILGWDCLSAEVEFEYYVQKRGRADIALYVRDEEIPKILIEVKPIQDNINNAATQMFSRYLAGTKVSFGITTNGKLLMLFDKFRVKKQYQKARLLFSLKMEDFDKYNDVLSVLSRDSVQSGVLDKLAKAYHYEYSKWCQQYKRKYNDYSSPLIFAQEFLSRS